VKQPHCSGDWLKTVMPTGCDGSFSAGHHRQKTVRSSHSVRLQKEGGFSCPFN
jgi:hypothetical protein